MSANAGDSSRTFHSSSMPQPRSLQGSDRTRSGASALHRSRTEAERDQHGDAVENSAHSYPKAPGSMPISYGQQSVGGESGIGRMSPHGFNFVPPPSATLPGGSGAPSPFVGFAPGFPVQQQFPATMISPLPPFNIGYNQHHHHPGMNHPVYSASTPYPYQVPNYNQRAHTTGSIALALPPHQQPFVTQPSTSYSTAFGGQPGQGTIPQSKADDGQEEECFNLFWLFFLLGPLTWPCALFGICSDRRTERMAGFVSCICLILVLVAIVVILTRTDPDSSNS